MIKLVAIGGGENGRARTKYETRAIDVEIVKLSNKLNPKLLFIPPPSPFQEDYFKVVSKVFTRLGCEVSPLYTTDKYPVKQLEKIILSADIIYVGGGNTLRMMKQWRKQGVDKILKKAAKKNIILSGLSAGAICWFSSGCSDSRRFTTPGAPLIKVKALDLIPALLCPHYDVEKSRKPDLKRIMKTTSGIALALDNCAAIEIIDDKFRIITSKSTAKAYKVYWKKGVFHEDLIRIQKEFLPLSQLIKK